MACDEEAESVSKTLEYAYDDWCIAQLAKAANNDSLYQQYIRRAQAYKNLYDPSTNFLRGRIHGGWFGPFDPSEVNFNYTEANGWQYTLFAPQDIQGLIDVGKEMKIPVEYVDKEELAKISAPNPSETVNAFEGTSSVSEAAAIKVSRGELIVEKQKFPPNLTIAIARILD